MFILTLSLIACNTINPIINEQPLPSTVTPTLTLEQIPDPSSFNEEINDVSIGTRAGEIFLNASYNIYDFLSDFNDVVNLTGFFRTGYREFYDAIRSENGEELVLTTINRIAEKNDVTVLDIDIIDDNKVKTKVQSEEKTLVESFCLDLEKLSFIKEAYISNNTDDEDMFNYDVIIIIGYD